MATNLFVIGTTHGTYAATKTTSMPAHWTHETRPGWRPSGRGAIQVQSKHCVSLGQSRNHGRSPALQQDDRRVSRSEFARSGAPARERVSGYTAERSVGRAGPFAHGLAEEHPDIKSFPKCDDSQDDRNVVGAERQSVFATARMCSQDGCNV